MKALVITLIMSTFLTAGSIYDFKVTGLDGKDIDLSAYKGKKILIVNTASKCGLTPQFEGLEALYKKYKDKLPGCPSPTSHKKPLSTTNTNSLSNAKR